ncbi:unnamed protein product [Bursaphelenchus xylophilus]|uniref:(pine wood nematode) hypothetical protein n=1 Tax=Bursaphelenchus xylophilus TaxID=6326 RepID=A0A1I7SAQ0_BURXY|nr:unnamed protein product [Bursaphelenchus xylophilus]CAG9126902.1 unnamed protein product [Bursaphelenchus xylophilus]
MFDPRRLIEPTNVPFGWATKSLDGRDERWDGLRRKYSIAAGHAEVISGAGFLSYVLRVVFVFDGTTERFSAILKVPTVEKLMAAQMVIEEAPKFDNILIKLHNQEILFYKEIANKCDVFYFPKMYAYVVSDEKNATHGRILVEDVGDKGMLPDVLQGMDLKQCTEAIQVLAKFHAFTLLNLSEEFLEKLKECNTNQKENIGMTPATYELDPYFMENREDLKEIAEKHGEVEYNIHRLHGIPPVLVHGDFWGNNMFFEKKNDGSMGEKLFTVFDWQLLRPGTGMGDIARFLVVSATAEVLANNLEGILKLYYDTMQQCLHRNGERMPYSYEQMKIMFRYEFPFEFVFAAMLLPVMVQGTDNEKVKQGVVNRLKIGFDYVKKFSDRLTH